MRLAFRTFTPGEALRTAYWDGARYLEEGCAGIGRVLRDHCTGKICPIAPQLLDLLWELSRTLGGDDPFLVTSGSRSARGNAMLASTSTGVSRKSLQMLRQAIDVRLERVPLEALHRAAIELKGGGDGLYRRAGFVHLGVGRVRDW